MLFNSISFLLFFPLVLLVYYVVPKKTRYIWLLVCSYYFYMCWNAKYAILIAASTLITYISGILLQNAKKGRKWIVAASFVSNLGILFFFKYFDFALGILNRILGAFSLSLVDKPFDLLLPVGISFYTFQALSYTMDVYAGKMKAEKNLLRYALFVSFFPQLVAGPIERSTSLLTQLEKLDRVRAFPYERVTRGLAMMLWGYFMKLVIADRLALLVDPVFNNYAQYTGMALLFAAVLFAFQIYCDFGSYSMIAIGSAKVLGITLMENFNTPYFSRSIAEFWRRWHISLSTWFRDYLYIPLGGSRKGKLRTNCNLMLTFLVSGLWHGASFAFVAWGLLHGLFQVVARATKPLKEKIHNKLKLTDKNPILVLWQVGVTFLLVDFAWIFFRAASFREGLFFIEHMIRTITWRSLVDGTMFDWGLSRVEMAVALVALLVLLFVDLIRYFKQQTIEDYMAKKPLFIRWLFYLFLMGSIFVFGIYGTAFDASSFIYFQF